MEELSHITCPNIRLNDHTLDKNLPTYQPRASHFQPATTSQGALERLPTELLEHTLLYLDLRALTNFQYVNRRSAGLVNNLPAYKIIVTHARDALRGILCIQIGKWITTNMLLEKLRTADCEQCGDFGGYLYLLTCERVCFLCFSEKRRYLPLKLSHACRKFGLERADLKNLPCMRVIPGIYSPNEKKAIKTVLVDYESALNCAVVRHGSLDAMQRFVADQNAQRLADYEKRLEEAKRAGSTRRIRKPPTEDPFDGRSGNPFRFVAVVRAPWLNKSVPASVEYGFYCLGCAKSSRFPLHWRRKFSDKSFNDHIRQCGDIENGIHIARQNCKVEVTETG